MATINVNDPNIYRNNLGLPTDGAALLADLTKVFNESNAQDIRLNSIESNVSTFAGAKTFTGGITTNTLSVTGAATFGQLPAVQNGLVTTPLRRYLAEDIAGGAPTWTGATTFTITRLAVPTFDFEDAIETDLTLTVDLATTGLNGLDTGTLAANTSYYAYAVKNPTTGLVGMVVSASSTAPTLTHSSLTGYTLYGPLPGPFLRTNASAVVRPWFIQQWGRAPMVLFLGPAGQSEHTWTITSLANGVWTTSPALTATSPIPAEAKGLYLDYLTLPTSAVNTRFAIRPTGIGVGIPFGFSRNDGFYATSAAQVYTPTRNGRYDVSLFSSNGVTFTGILSLTVLGYQL